LLGKIRNCADNAGEARTTSPPPPGPATRIARRNEAPHKELNPHGIVKSPISPNTPNEIL